jgi:hypothetical protein
MKKHRKLVGEPVRLSHYASAHRRAAEGHFVLRQSAGLVAAPYFRQKEELVIM